MSGLRNSSASSLRRWGLSSSSSSSSYVYSRRGFDGVTASKHGPLKDNQLIHGWLKNAGLISIYQFHSRFEFHDWTFLHFNKSMDLKTWSADRITDTHRWVQGSHLWFYNMSIIPSLPLWLSMTLSSFVDEATDDTEESSIKANRPSWKCALPVFHLIGNSRKSVRWSAEPVPCLSRLLRLLCFHTYGVFSSVWDLGLGRRFGTQGRIWALRLGFGPLDKDLGL